MGKLIQMLFPETMLIAARNLQRNRRRSLLSISIIAIAVFALTSAGGFGLYTYESLRESTARDSGHITITTPDYFSLQEEMPLSNGIVEPYPIIKKVTTLEEVRGVQPRIELSGLISNGDKSSIFMGFGVNSREFDMKGPFLDVKSGRTLSNVNSRRYDPSEPEVMLGVDLAANMNVQVGDWITLLATTSDGALNALDFKVRGIYSSGVPELDKRQLYLHINNAQELLSSEKVSMLSVFLFDTGLTDLLSEEILQLLGGESFQALELTPWHKRAFFYDKVKDLYDRIFAVMGMIMSVVVFVALFNTMTMSVTERTREIGTLSAMGCYPGEIVAGFMREAGLIALIGSVMGIVLTAITTFVLFMLELEMPPPPGRTDGYPLAIQFSPVLALLSLSTVMVICLFTAFLSARQGVKKPITEALTYV